MSRVGVLPDFPFCVILKGIPFGGWDFMAVVEPLRGIRYNLARLGRDLSAVTAPPYDVIGPNLHEVLLSQEHNIVWLDLNPAPADEHAPGNRYERSAALLRQWLAEGLLVQEEQPALYVVEQEYRIAGQSYRRRGFLARVRLGEALAHEFTFAGPKADRLQLMLATGCNLSPIFGFYPDEQNEVFRPLEPELARTPDFMATEGIWTASRLWTPLAEPTQAQPLAGEGALTCLWIVTRPEIIAEVSRQMAPRSLFIADGHHRYETALEYRRRLEAEHGPLPADHPANFVLFYCVSINDPGLRILPTHRCVHHLRSFSVDQLQHASEEFFTWEVVPFDPNRPETALDAIAPAGPQAFGFLETATRRLYRLRPREEDPLAALIPQESPLLRRLNVTLLHRLLIDRLLEPTFGPPSIHHVHLVHRAGPFCHEEDSQGAFLLHPPSLSLLCELARQGQRMPQKSTYFYPKVLTGLVINPLF